MADNSVVSGGIWPKFELIQAFMNFLVTCKNEEDAILNEDDPIKNGGARVASELYVDFSGISVVNGGIWPKFEHIQACHLQE